MCLWELVLIDSPQYWKDNAVKGKTTNGEYAGFLIKRMATYIKKYN